MKILSFKDYDELSNEACNIILNQVNLKPNSILGLATGSTPLGMYKHLIKAYKNNLVDFSKVKTFNLDEYLNLNKENNQSYYYFMMHNLFNHINIDINNINIPNGNAKDMLKECEEYENKINNSAGVDIQVLGIGVNGHIGFNEPSNFFEPKTHIVTLDEKTIESNSRFFSSKEEVPTKAITMGIKTIMKAKKIILLANGENKADAIFKTVNGKIDPKVPASILQLHNDVTILLDKESASKL